MQKKGVVQVSDTIFMVEPINFYFNQETAENNYFQENLAIKDSQEKALQEFNAMVELLQNNGIRVLVKKDSPEPKTPDSIFPNNWFSTQADGTLILYPMFAHNRRLERIEGFDGFLESVGFEISRTINYAKYEQDNLFLEGTGSMIFDHENRLIYAAISERTNEVLFLEFCKDLDFKPIAFRANQTHNGKRLPIYHTNVMMCLGSDLAIICLDSIDDSLERQNVVESLKKTNKTVVEISETQMHQFAGNMLQVKNGNEDQFLVMSDSAYMILGAEQVKAIEKYCTILHPNITTIERLGGGSARCMMAEIFLPKKV